MGSSFLTLEEPIPETMRYSPYRKFGYWAAESTLVPWFRCLACVVRERGEVPEWLAELRDYWEQFDDAWGGGIVHCRSDEFLTTNDRKQIILDLSAATLQRLLDRGGDFYEGFPVTKPIPHCLDCPATPPLTLSEKVGIIEIGISYARLVEGMSGGFWPAATIGYLARSPAETRS